MYVRSKSLVSHNSENYKILLNFSMHAVSIAIAFEKQRAMYRNFMNRNLILIERSRK